MACQGTPSSCAGTPCNGSPETIGDIVLGTTASANGVAITEINSVWVRNGGGPTIGGDVIGWLYMTATGVKLFQANFQNKVAWSGSVGANLGKVFNISLSAATPGGYGAVGPWNGSLPPGGTPTKCESKGGALV